VSAARDKFNEKLIESIDLLDTELANLRILVLEILKNYQARLENDIRSLRNSLLLLKNSSNKNWIKLSLIEKFIKELNALETKPEFGRRKDLKKIEKVLLVLNKQLEKLK